MRRGRSGGACRRGAARASGSPTTARRCLLLLALRTPVRDARVVALRRRADGDAATGTRPANAAVDLSRRPPSVERRPHQPMRRLEHRPQLVVRDLVEPSPRRDARLPQRFGPPEVADSGHEALVEKGVAELALRCRAQPSKHRLEVGRLAEDVRPQPRRPARPNELELGAVPEHGLVLFPPQYEPRLANTRRPSRFEPPAALHAQVAPEDEAALEAEEEVLPDRLDPVEPPAVEALG